MIPEEIQKFEEAAALEAQDPTVLAGGQFDRGELTLDVARAKIAAACEWFKSRGYVLLEDITATDWWPVEPRLRVVYHLYAIPGFKRVRLAVRVPGDDPRLDSVTSVYPAANWYERELYDLFGVHFNGHPDLRRIMMPDDWEGHPLRKDFPTEGLR